MAFCNNTILFVLLFMLNTSLMNHICICKASDQDPCIPSERQALLKFKHYLLDPSNRLTSWSENTNCCNWTSVVCNNVSGHILQLHLRTSYDDYAEYESFERSRFGGEIDPSILALSYLSYLDLSGNDFGDMQIPSFLGSMKSLTYLNLSYAGFSGNIPHQIGNLSNLLHLDLGSNHFTGKIPHQIGNLSNLLYLCLEGGYRYDDMDEISIYVENLQWMSSLSSLQYLKLGTVNMSNSFDWFHVLQSLPSLVELHLRSCAFPHLFSPTNSINFSSLVVLDLSNNYYDLGAYLIPKWISQLKNLVSLQLSDNWFNSSIPEWLYTLTHLKSLSLSGNNLQGPISHAIGNLTSLVTLDLHSNQLEGPTPSSLGNLSSLNYLDLSGNSIHGAIPISLGNLSSLNHLDLSGNSIHGAIPISLGNLSSLNYLDLSRNSIQGVIPISLGNLSSLNHLSLYDNSIHGAIPISLGNLFSLNYLDLSLNKIGGNPFDVVQSLSALQSLDISDNLFEGEVTEDHLANFTKLYSFSASTNKLILKVGLNWNPPFQNLQYLDMTSWNLGPHFPSWMKSLKRLEELFISNTNIFDSIPTWVWDASPYARVFDFSNNNIHGDLSHTIKNPINVSSIYLSSNNLSGPLPHISPNVFHLDLSNNSFSGSLDSFLCQGKVKQMGLIRSQFGVK
ncbi:hypothetical protein K1719_020699 [Acacia pycnantha]|nr:hypothetical protein K1719_020699 [Acacia pycnantha]